MATIALTIVVSRILSPGDFGIIAMVAPVTAFILLFQNLGLSQATIQAPTLTDEQSNAMFWLNVAASIVLSTILIAAAPLVAWFYGDDRAGLVTAASAATVLVSGVAIQHIALLNRSLRFGVLGIAEISAAATTLLVTIGAALLTESYWSLWLGTFAGALASAIVAWSFNRWRPTRTLSFAGMARMIGFGAHLTGFSLLNFFSRNLDNVLIGRMWGPIPLGLYDRAYRLMMFPLVTLNGPLGSVMVPVLSRVQDDPERFRRFYLQALRLLLLLSVPGIAVAGATGERLVPWLLGDDWSGAVPIFFWLSLAALFQPLGNATGWLFIAKGRGRDMMYWGAVSAAIMIAAFAVGVQFGAAGVAKAYFLAILLIVPPLLAWSSHRTAVHWYDFYRVALPHYASAAAIWAITQVAPSGISFPALLAGLLTIAYGLSFGCEMASADGRRMISTMWMFMRQSLERQRPSNPTLS